MVAVAAAVIESGLAWGVVIRECEWRGEAASRVIGKRIKLMYSLLFREQVNRWYLNPVSYVRNCENVWAKCTIVMIFWKENYCYRWSIWTDIISSERWQPSLRTLNQYIFLTFLYCKLLSLCTYKSVACFLSQRRDFPIYLTHKINIWDWLLFKSCIMRRLVLHSLSIFFVIVGKWFSCPRPVA